MILLEKLKKIPTEYEEQKILIEWVRLSESKYPCLKFLFSTLGGVRLTMGQSIKAKQSGLIRGVPDIFLLFPSNKYHGLAIELKRSKGGVVSDEQENFLNYLNGAGYYATVCRGAKEAIECIVEYLEG